MPPIGKIGAGVFAGFMLAAGVQTPPSWVDKQIIATHETYQLKPGGGVELAFGVSFGFNRHRHVGTITPGPLAPTYDTRFGTATDANGWITFGLNAGNRRVWVDSVNGNDTNDGLTAATAKASLNAGMALLVAGTGGDQLMLAGGQGQTYVDGAQYSTGFAQKPGISATYPTAMLCYDSTDPTNSAKYGKLDGSKKPKIFTWQQATLTASASATTLTVAAVSSGTIFTGMKLFGGGLPSSTEILSQLSGTTGGAGTYHLNQSVTASSSTIFAQGSTSFDLVGDQGGTLHNYAIQGVDFDAGPNNPNAAIVCSFYHNNYAWQNCRFAWMGISIDLATSTFGRASGYHVSKCSLYGMWDDERGDHQAIFAHCDDLYVQNNVFIHPGYRNGRVRDDPAIVGGATQFGHGLYYHANSLRGHFDRNVGIDCESDHWGMRGDAACTQPFSMDNAAPEAVTGYSGDYTEQPLGATVTVDDFVICGGQNVNSSLTTHGGGIGTHNTATSGCYVNNGVLFDNPYSSASQLITLNTSTTAGQVAQFVNVTNIRVHNYATSRSLDIFTGGGNTASATLSNCLLESLVSNINGTPTTPLGGTNRLWTAGDYPNAIARSDLITTVCTALGIANSKASLMNVLLAFPHLDWARYFLNLCFTAYGVTPIYQTASAPSLAGLPAAEVVYKTTLSDLTLASSFARAPSQTISSITIAGYNTCTVTTASAHGLSSGQMIALSGATPSGYNVGAAPIVVTSPTTFTYLAPNPPVGSATVVGSYLQATTLEGAGANSSYSSTDLPAGFALTGSILTFDGSGSGSFPTFHITETNTDGAGTHLTTFFPSAGATLSAPTDSVTGSTTATIGVTTDTGSGTLYWVVSTSSTTPTAAQIEAGHDSTGGAGAAASNQAVSASGAQSVSVTGLTASTTYYAYFVQHTTVDSNVVGTTSFTTSGASWTPASLGANLVWWAEPKPANLTKVGGGTPVDGDQVSAITDLSGNSHTLSQGTTGKYPVYHTDGTHYWLTFSGGQFLFSSTSVTIGDASGQHTAFSTVNAPNTTTTQSVLDMDNQNGAGRLSQLLRLNAGNSESIEFNSTGTSFTGVGPAVSINTKHVISEITKTTQVQAFTDGTGGSATAVTGTLSTFYGTLNLGCRNAANVSIGQPYTGNWYGGFVAKGVVGSTDLASAQTYMAALAP